MPVPVLRKYNLPGPMKILYKKDGQEYSRLARPLNGKRALPQRLFRGPELHSRSTKLNAIRTVAAAATTYLRTCRFLPVLALILPLVAHSATEKPVLIAEFGGPGTSPGQFDSPYAVAVDSQGKIIVADSFNNRIQICDIQGRCSTFGSAGTQPGQFLTPMGVAVDSEDRIFVSDTDNDRVQVCDHQGNCSAFGGLGSALGRFDAPTAMAVDSEDHLVVADQNNGRIQICSRQGDCTSLGRLAQFPLDAMEPDEFGFIQGVAVDRHDRILVSEDIGGDVPKSLRSCQPQCSQIGIFELPRAVAVDRANRIFLWENGSVLRCDRGARCDTLELAGEPAYLVGLAFTQNNDLVVSNTFDHKIRIFRNSPALQINAGLNDAWYNPSTAGQGFFVIVFPAIESIFMSWFTYDLERPGQAITAQLGEPGHRWLTAQGPFDGNIAVLDAYNTRGGVFDSPQPPTASAKYGQIILQFDNCQAGTVSYHIDSTGSYGIIPVERIVQDNVPLCEALRE